MQLNVAWRPLQLLAVGVTAAGFLQYLLIRLQKHRGIGIGRIASQNPKHLYFLVHGFSGKPEQLRYLQKRIEQNPDAIAVCNRSNWGVFGGVFATADGIDRGGRRLAEEIREFAAQYPSLETFSIFGDGVGGLYARYAVGLLWDKNKETICGLMPLNYVSLATPHLGMRHPFNTILRRTAARLVGDTGRQLLLEDCSNFPDPLLLRMTEDGSPFMSALCSFKHKAFYSDANSFNLEDGTFCSGHAVTTRPGNLKLLRSTSLDEVDNELYPHLVSVHHDTSTWSLSQGFRNEHLPTEVEAAIARNLANVAPLRVTVHFKTLHSALSSYLRWTKDGQDVVDHIIENLSGNRPIRIWVDGCFDMMHFGHANAFRQARSLGDVLVVGLNPDAEVTKHKGGPPIMDDDERYEAVAGCKWVDEVVPNVPYMLDDEWMQMLYDKYKIDYIVHGDDPCFTADGQDVYARAKKLGRFKTIKRTEGVSTTDLVGRMLLRTRDHHEKDSNPPRRGSDVSDSDLPMPNSNFLATTRRLTQFANNRAPRATDKVVYVDGAFDLFHAGHIRFLKRAKALGDFLVVGIHRDDDLNIARGSNFPIMNLHERTLGVLSCRFVDEVIIGAPFELTKDLIVSMNITVVAVGSKPAHGGLSFPTYSVARQMGILQEIDSGMGLNTLEIVNRIIKNRDNYEAKFEKKSKQEAAYNEQKTYVEEN